ncbi:hypothetical protein GA0070609_3140 [Micromonospora echinaurantiaca]|uniref:Uncharacterized protein n=1 Tax=Micromonospora echinaurantiaca TaxID=47857 RepID=A0A1C5ID32_9ACTN|nr:hypothetical protein [Micromonospora echinaurantiaca]SCG56260.1 hypothetical protein GA0070609_3140 [Micromonospora echinaurantiaca]
MSDDGRETVLLPRTPQVFALYRCDSISNSMHDVLGWILALPGGEILMVRGLPGAREVIWSESLSQVESFWAPMAGADVVLVTETRDGEPSGRQR